MQKYPKNNSAKYLDNWSQKTGDIVHQSLYYDAKIEIEKKGKISFKVTMLIYVNQRHFN